MNLHSEIMNIQVPPKTDELYLYSVKEFSAHKAGHRDARHAAAELSLKAEARIEELENTLQEFLDRSESFREDYCGMDSVAERAVKLLESKE